MGTDIDLYVEKRNAKGEWELLFPSPDMAEQLHGKWGKDQDYGPDKMSGWAWYSQRNYVLFALLANVRNRFGIESPWKYRGMPADSQLTENDSERYGHSTSHVTLQELLDYDWDTGIFESGWVSTLSYQEFKEKGAPSSYSQGVGGGNVKQITNEEMDELFVNGTLVETPFPTKDLPDRTFWTSTDDNSYFTKVEWRESMRDACGSFLTWTLPALKEFTKGTDPANVRLTYWFDC